MPANRRQKAFGIASDASRLARPTKKGVPCPEAALGLIIVQTRGWLLSEPAKDAQASRRRRPHCCLGSSPRSARPARARWRRRPEDERRGGKADVIPNQHPRTPGSRRTNERNAARFHRVTAQRGAARDCAQDGKMAPLGINAGESPAESLRDRVRCVKTSTTDKERRPPL